MVKIIFSIVLTGAVAGAEEIKFAGHLVNNPSQDCGLRVDSTDNSFIYENLKGYIVVSKNDVTYVEGQVDEKNLMVTYKKWDSRTDVLPTPGGGSKGYLSLTESDSQEALIYFQEKTCDGVACLFPWWPVSIDEACQAKKVE